MTRYMGLALKLLSRASLSLLGSAQFRNDFSCYLLEGTGTNLGSNVRVKEHELVDADLRISPDARCYCSSLLSGSFTRISVSRNEGRTAAMASMKGA